MGRWESESTAGVGTALSVTGHGIPTATLGRDSLSTSGGGGFNRPRVSWGKREKRLPLTGDKVAQLVRCRTSNQRVAGSIPGHSGHFGRSWAKQFIPYCFSLPSCKMGT